MTKERYYDIWLLRSDVEKDAKEDGLTFEQEVNFLKKANQEDSELPVRIEVVDDWKCMPSGNYEKEYKIRRAIAEKNHIITGIPYEFIKRQAAKNKMNVEQFLLHFKAVASYGKDDYIIYRFRKWY